MDKVDEFYKKAKQIVDSPTWLKIIFIGDAQCGKTSIIKSFFNISLNNEYNPTIGTDYGFKLYRSIQPDISKEIRVNIWDFSGDPDFLDSRKDLYINTDIVIIVFDLCRPETLVNLKKWIKEFQMYSNRDMEDTTFGILANKSDLKSQRMVDNEMGQELAESLSGFYFETSSRYQINIQESFQHLIETSVSRKMRKSNDTSTCISK